MDGSRQYYEAYNPAPPQPSSQTTASTYGSDQYYHPQVYSNYHYSYTQQHPQESLHPPGVPIQTFPSQYQHHYYAACHQHQPPTCHQHQPPTCHQHQPPTCHHDAGPLSYLPPAPIKENKQISENHDRYYATWQQQADYSSGAITEAAYVPPLAPVAPSYSGGGRRGGRGGGFSSSFHARGRGRGRCGPTNKPIPAQKSAPPPQMAWCELCRVDCNTSEILEKHTEGKKHKKNLKMREELERLDKILVERQNKNVEEQEAGESGTGNTQNNVSDMGGSKGHGSKRKMRGGKGGNKWVRTSESSKGQVDPPKRKQPPVPFVCELCHVTCESQVVFDSHLKGRKHMGNIQYIQEQQTLLGHAALEALYPALQALIPSLEGSNPPNPDGSSSSTLASQSQQDGQDSQVILTQLLTSLLTSGQVGVIPGLTSIYPNQKHLLQPESVKSEADPAVTTIEKKSEKSTVKAEPEEVGLQLVNSEADHAVAIKKEAEVLTRSR